MAQVQGCLPPPWAAGGALGSQLQPGPAQVAASIWRVNHKMENLSVSLSGEIEKPQSCVARLILRIFFFSGIQKLVWHSVVCKLNDVDLPKMCLNQAFLRKWLHYSQNKHTFRGMWFFCEALCFLNRQGQARDACLRFDLHFSPILCKENSGILLGIPILVRKIQQNSTVKNMVFVAHEIFP